jgi:hypothetical protein
MRISDYLLSKLTNDASLAMSAPIMKHPSGRMVGMVWVDTLYDMALDLAEARRHLTDYERKFGPLDQEGLS